MQQFFGFSLTSVDIGLGIGLIVLVVGMVLLGVWGTPLFKLGVRNLPRRPARAILIVCGLTLSTTVIGSAFGTGDTITSTLRALVTDSLGTTDEAIVLNPPRPSNTDTAKALANGAFGGLKATDLGFFPAREYERVQDATRDTSAIAAVAPAITDQVTVVHGETQQLRTAVGLLAIPTPAPAFGLLRAIDGTPVTLEALGPDELVINAAAAAIFAARPGDMLTVRTDERRDEWPVRIAVIVEDGGIAGARPLLIAPLANYQAAIGRRGQINQILVANAGGLASVTRTRAATTALRVTLANRDAARALRAVLAKPEIQRGLIEAEGALHGRERTDLAALRAEALKPETTDRFIALLTDPRVRRDLGYLARSLPSGADRRAAFTNLQSVAILSVVEVKQEGFEQADTYGSVVTTVFLVLGLFSLGAAVLLIGLIFALLATDRGPELATLRALGMSSRQIMSIFLVEGLIYDLIGSALGAAIGIVATRLTVASLAEALADFGFRLDTRVEPRSVMAAFAAGALLTFAAIGLSAWRVSHTQIVAATHGEEESEGRWGGIAAGIVLLIAGALIWRRWHEPALPYLPRYPLVAPGALSLILSGAAGGVGAILRLRPMARRERLADGLALGAGAAITGFWLRMLASLPTVGGDTRGDAIAAAVGGLALILTSVWTATHALGPALRGLDHGLAPFAGLRLIVRPAAGYLSALRWRTGLTVIMFGMIVFIMVAALTMIETLVNAYAGQEPPVAGYDLRAELPANGSTPLDDMEVALADATAVRRDAFGAIGGLVSLDARVVQLGAARASWRNAQVVAADDGFLAGITARFERRAMGYDNDAAIWRAVREEQGLAVVTGANARTFLTPPAGGSDDFAPFTIWVRPATGGRPTKLTVIGIVDPRSEIDTGVYISRATAAGLAIVVSPPRAYYLALAPGTRAPDAAEGLRVSFAEHSLVVTDLGATARIGRSVRALLTKLVQGFMGLGLVAGVAALGILGVQAVIERRQHLGTLRALGFTRMQTGATLAFESAMIAALGIALGTGLGLVLARSLVALLAARNPEIRYGVPWDQIALTVAIASAGALGSLALAAAQAGRVSPADAVRAT